MKNLLMLLLFGFSSISFSQEKIQMVADLSGSFSKEVISNTSSQLYGGINFSLGLKFNCANKGDLSTSLAYQFSSNVITYSSTGGNTEDNSFIIYKSLLRSHFIGGSLKYIFRAEEKRFRPFVIASALTEINTNYKNGYLLANEFIPRDDANGYEGSYYSYLYQSTPFVGSFQVGCAIRLVKDLHLNIAAGYGLRIMKIKYAEWDKNEDFHEKLKTIPTQKINSHMLDVQLGLSYTFSFKRSKESE